MGFNIFRKAAKGPASQGPMPAMPSGGATRIGGGKASIVVTPSGKVSITAEELEIHCSGPVTLNGQVVNLPSNPSVNAKSPSQEKEMSPSDLSSKQASDAQTESTTPGEYLGDLERTATIAALLQVSHEERDDAWRARFWENLPDASFSCGDPQVIQGPDGWNYFVLKIPESGKQFQCFVLRKLIPQFLLEQGLGVAINPTSESVDWVINYGQLLGFHQLGEFCPQPPGPEPANDEQEMVSAASEALLPQVTRNAMKRYFGEWGLDGVRVALSTKIPSGQRELVFVVDQALFKQQDRLHAFMEHLDWFTPPGLGFTLTGSANSNFQSAQPL